MQGLQLSDEAIMKLNQSLSECTIITQLNHFFLETTVHPSSSPTSSSFSLAVTVSSLLLSVSISISLPPASFSVTYHNNIIGTYANHVNMSFLKISKIDRSIHSQCRHMPVPVVLCLFLVALYCWISIDAITPLAQMRSAGKVRIFSECMCSHNTVAQLGQWAGHAQVGMYTFDVLPSSTIVSNS